MTIKEEIGEEQAQKLRNRLEETLDNDEGIIIIISKNKVTDYYQGHCFEHTMAQVETTVSDFFKIIGGNCNETHTSNKK